MSPDTVSFAAPCATSQATRHRHVTRSNELVAAGAHAILPKMLTRKCCEVQPRMTLKRLHQAANLPPDAPPPKRSRTSIYRPPPGQQRPPTVTQDLLLQFYPTLRTLRQYLLESLPTTSRIRRKKLAAVGHHSLPGNQQSSHVDLELTAALDSILICSPSATIEPVRSDPPQPSASQNVSHKSQPVVAMGSTPPLRQSEIVDYAIRLVFSQSLHLAINPKHLLCQGYRRSTIQPGAGAEPRRTITTVSVEPDAVGAMANQTSRLVSLCSVVPNHHVSVLKASPWPETLALLGRVGEDIMLNLLTDCAIFVPLKNGYGNFYQLSGLPLFELPRVSDETAGQNASDNTAGAHRVARSPSAISLIRSRMLYARPALTARASVNTGLRHIHVLNRCPFAGAPGDSSIALAQPSDANSTKVLAYIFPRQFGLHNVFTSATDRQKTAQKFHDYTLREDELLRKFGSKTRPSASALLNIQIPKRLRVAAQHLVQRLQIRHSRCSYSQLLYHHCPTFLDTPSGLQGPPRPCRARQNGVRRGRPGDAPTSYLQSCIEGKSLVELASPIAAVSAFCQATISKIIPNAFWGVGSTGEQNKHVVLKKIDRFIKLRRFESMTLHEIAQDFKVRLFLNYIIQFRRILASKWLMRTHSYETLSDTRKRTEIFLEFIYYVFDSLLIPLVRSNFYVTESSTHRLRLFYFRHDVWRLVAEPAMTNLKTTLFEEVRLQDALLMLSQRRLGFAHLRLLPKNASMRPIINLRRRALPQRGGGRFLGPSINSVLAPVQSMFNLEKSRNPSRLGSAMFCVGDMYPRIRAFAASLSDGSSRPRLWFAKVDVQAAFDSIPQAAVLQLMASVPTQSRYTLAKHVEFKPGEMAPASGSQVGRALRRWLTLALDHPEQGEDENMGRKDWQALHQRLNGGLASTHKHTVFVDSGYRRVQSTAELLDLLTQHIEQNLVKVGKKYYRQRQGIPQGSVLSPLLCSYFYADLERAKLGFVASSSDANNSAGSHGPQSLLLRLFDDWLLISTERAKAERFVRLMHAGVPEYGVNINPSKTLVNFDLQIDGRPVPRALDDRSFPYCGVIVDCQSLDIRKDGRVGKDDAIFCSLTVDNSSHAGHSFQRKVIRAFRIQSHPMFFDTAHNSEQAVMSNIYDAFAETAKKMWAHALCIPARQRPLQHLVIDTISKTISAATVLLVGRTRRARYPGYEFTVSKVQITRKTRLTIGNPASEFVSLACAAFKQVLAGKQAGYAGVIQWLEQRARAVEPGVSHRRRSLKRRHASARIEQARDYGRS